MKIIICKVFEESGVERKIGKLVSKERKRAASLRLFCVDEQIQKRLESAHLQCELLPDLGDELADEPSWEYAYRLCDKWHASCENNDALKFWGINFLECPITYQVFITKFCKLRDKLAGESCKVAIIVLSKHFNERLPNINSPKIRTIVYGKPSNRGLTYSAFRYLIILMNKIRGRLGLLTEKRLAPVPSEDHGQKRALFVISSIGGKMLYLYTTTVLAIIDQCRSRGIVPYVVMEDHYSLPAFRSRGVECAVIPSLPLSCLGKYLLLLYRLRRHISSLEDNIRDLSAESLGKKKLLEFLPSLCYSAVTYISYFRRILAVNPPDIVCIVPDSAPPQKMAAAVARKYHIPSMTVLSAILYDHPILGAGRLVADRVAVMGEMARAIYLKKGIAPERVIVTGIAHFDHIFRRNREQDKEILSKFKIDPSKRIIVFATEAISIDETVAMIKGTIEAVLKIEDSLFVIKVHPREEIEPYEKIAESYHDSQIHVVRDIDLYALLHNCQLLITQFSTTGLEAMMFDKPVVIINLFGKPERIPYVTSGAVLGVYHYQDIEPAINKALFDEETRSRLKERRDGFVYNYAYKTDGKSSQRIVELMNEMILQKLK
jgi:glycosyltransferase involved in cell wall biosynthesis